MKITKSELTELVKDEMVRRFQPKPAKKQAVRMTEARLRLLVEEELTQAGGSIAAAGGQAASLKKLKDHLNGAKQALGELYQSATSPKASEQAHTLLSGITRVLQALDTMPELTAGKQTPAGDMARRRMGSNPPRG